MGNNEIQGIVKAVRRDKKGLLIDDKWYSNKFLDKDIECQKGDKVQVYLSDKGFLQDVKVLEKTTQTYSNTQMTAEERNEARVLVDTGNTLQRAVELTTTIINNSKAIENVPEVLNEAVNQCLKQFRRIKYDLSNQNPEPNEKVEPEEIQIEKVE